MVDSSILRMGPTQDSTASAKLLKTALMAYFAKLRSDDIEKNDSNNDSDLRTSSFLIQNKYFTAHVSLQDIEEVPDTSKDASSKEDGIILVFDGLQSNPDRPVAASASSTTATFDAMAVAHEMATTKHECGDLLRLCVGVSLTELSAEEWRGAGSTAEEEYSRRILWCLDHGYEYIEANISQEAQAQGHDVRDKEGFARIVEAIQGTIWSSAVMSNSKSTQLKNELQQDASMIRSQTTEREEEEKEENPYVPPSIEMPSSPSKETDDGGNEDSQKENNGNKNNHEEILLGNSKEGATGPEDTPLSDAQSEKVFDEMDGVLKEARRIRDASKAGSLTDDERRERAGDAALALVNLMSSLGFEDDEEGDSSDDE